MRPLLVAAFVFLMPVTHPVSAQQKTTTEQAQKLLQTRPDLVAQLRQRIATSGLTSEQIRARLRAEGYPDTLLDAYLSEGARAPTDSLPNEDVFRAIRSLGIADSSDVADIRALLNGASRDSMSVALGDSLRADSLRRDSLRATGRSREDTTGRGPVPIFGLDLFRRSTSQFEPNLAGPVDANYRIGPGDQLVLILTGDVEAAHSLDVTREGFVVIPQVGQLYVANLTLGQLDDLLYTRLGRVYSGVRRGSGATTHFSVSVARLRSNQVFVVGDVERPGSYRISSAGTALTALYAAGGPTENGSLRQIEIRRGTAVLRLDVYDYLLRGDASRDVRLETGDIVFVPVHGPHVRIEGEVTRPAIYELTAGETLADAITMSGGFKATASRRRVQIERIAPPGQRAAGGGQDRYLLDVSSEALIAANGPPVRLEPGDVIRIFPIADRVRSRINVLGNVWLEGTQGFERGMRLSDALRGAGGVKSDTYLGQVLISRLRPDSTRIQLRASLRDTTGAAVDDVALADDDEIRVFSVSEFRAPRYVAITGAVRDPGRVPYHEGMTVRDLVLLAGGLRQSADLREAEIARLPKDRSGGVTAVTFRVPLDSSYLFERGRDGGYQGPPGLPAPAGPSPEQTLAPYDNVLILQQPDWQLQRTVSVAGEVRFPGVYTLVNKSERLSDVLKRAGGLNAEGYADGVQFYRRENGRIGINLPHVLRSSRDRENLTLEDGDSIYIPRFNPVVNVTGAVNSPVAVAYVPGQDIDYYVARAGGPSLVADSKRAFVTQPNGSVESRTRTMLFFPRAPSPKPGSVVTVPARDPNDKRDYTAMVGSIAQVMASLVAIIAIARR